MLEIHSVLCEACRDNERLDRVVTKQSLLLQKVTKQLEDTKLITHQLHLLKETKSINAC